jgi:hypothetical protein
MADICSKAIIASSSERVVQHAGECVLQGNAAYVCQMKSHHQHFQARDSPAATPFWLIGASWARGTLGSTCKGTGKAAAELVIDLKTDMISLLQHGSTIDDAADCCSLLLAGRDKQMKWSTVHARAAWVGSWAAVDMPLVICCD